MTLMRAFSKVDDEGRIPVPANVRRQAGLEPGKRVEIKVQGTANGQFIVVKTRKAAR